MTSKSGANTQSGSKIDVLLLPVMSKRCRRSVTLWLCENSRGMGAYWTNTLASHAFAGISASSALFQWARARFYLAQKRGSAHAFTPWERAIFWLAFGCSERI